MRASPYERELADLADALLRVLVSGKKPSVRDQERAKQLLAILRHERKKNRDR